MRMGLDYAIHRDILHMESVIFAGRWAVWDTTAWETGYQFFSRLPATWTLEDEKKNIYNRPRTD